MSRSVPLSLSVNHLVVTLGLAFVLGLSFRFGLGLLLCYDFKFIAFINATSVVTKDSLKKSRLERESNP